jgi:16S rRNA (guanine(966)-N(2))-methyltransferase RsmD
VKEALFNSIQTHLWDARVLDLFAGSGSLGIEALSRGAAHCVFNDLNPLATKVVSQNLKTLGLMDSALVLTVPAMDCLDRVEGPFDLILLDPPYHQGLLEPIIERIAHQRLLAEDGILIALHGTEEPPQPQECGIMKYRQKSYGITGLSHWTWEDQT